MKTVAAVLLNLVLLLVAAGARAELTIEITQVPTTPRRWRWCLCLAGTGCRTGGCRGGNRVGPGAQRPVCTRCTY